MRHKISTGMVLCAVCAVLFGCEPLAAPTAVLPDPTVICTPTAMPDAKQLLLEADKRSGGLDCYQQKMEINMGVSMASSTIALYGKSEVTALDLKSDYPEALNVTSMRVLGQTMTSTGYFSKDGRIYLDDGNDKTYSVGSFADSSFIISGSKSVNGNSASVTAVNGGMRVEVSEVSADFKEYLENKLFKNVEDIIGDADIEFRQMLLVFEINGEGYYGAVNITFSAVLTAAGKESVMTADIAIEYIDPGTRPEITPPSDLDTYRPTQSGIYGDDESLRMMIMYSLFNDDGGKAEDYDEQYDALCGQYGKKTVDSAIVYAEAYFDIGKNIDKLYDSDGIRSDSFDVELERLYKKHGDIIYEVVRDYDRDFAYLYACNNLFDENAVRVSKYDDITSQMEDMFAGIQEELPIIIKEVEMDCCIGLMFDESENTTERFDGLYKRLCSLYGKAYVDQYISDYYIYGWGGGGTAM